MTRLLLGALCVLACVILTEGAATVYTPPITLPKRRTLVVLNSEADKETFQKYFSHLESFLEVEYKTEDIALQKYGEYLYDNVVVFGLSRVLNGNLLEFVDGGNNLVIIAKPVDEEGDAEAALPENLREAAIECGIYFSDTNVVDNFHHHEKNDHILTSGVAKGAFLKRQHRSDIVYHGLGLQLEKNNPLLYPILTAQSTAFTAPAAEEDGQPVPQVMGTNVVLVAGLQTRRGSRITFYGSTALFASDAPEQNFNFVTDLSDWSFQNRGVLRYSEVQHSKRGNDINHPGYRIREFLSYSVKIEEFVSGKWVPFKANDIQLEFTMIDPYIRQSLAYDETKNDGTYSLDFQAPDTYGIYKFAVDYRRPGYAPLIFYNQTTIRPLRLNEYERYIPAAYPYYATTFSTLVAFLLFGLLFLNLKE